MYRVIQWSTGNVGRQALAAILDHPQLELVGVYARGVTQRRADEEEARAAELTIVRPGPHELRPTVSWGLKRR